MPRRCEQFITLFTRDYATRGAAAFVQLIQRKEREKKERWQICWKSRGWRLAGSDWCPDRRPHHKGRISCCRGACRCLSQESSGLEIAVKANTEWPREKAKLGVIIERTPFTKVRV